MIDKFVTTTDPSEGNICAGRVSRAFNLTKGSFRNLRRRFPV